MKTYSVSCWDRQTGEHLMWVATFEAETPAQAKALAVREQALFPNSTFAAALKLPAERIRLQANVVKSGQPAMYTEESIARHEEKLEG